MTIIKVYKRDGNIKSVSASGHTGYAQSGKDILCSAVSTLIQAAYLGLAKHLKISVVFKRNDSLGSFEMSLPKGLSPEAMKEAQIVLQTMLYGLKDIAFGNEKFIKLEEKDEVY